MADRNAVHDLSDTLVKLLQAAVGAGGMVNPGDISVTTPDKFHDLKPPAITIFLYRVAVNPMMRNGPRVTRPNGATTRPLLPLELSYLITPWGRDARDEHTLLGLILQALYDRTELGPADLQGTAWGPNDSVQLIQESLPTDEHYRIWDTVDMPYRLSLTYLARIMGIEPREEVSTAPVVHAEFGGRRL